MCIPGARPQRYAVPQREPLGVDAGADRRRAHGGRKCAAVRARLDGAAWEDGRLTAGYQSGRVKTTCSCRSRIRAAREAGELIVQALERNATFISADAAAPRLPAAVQPLRGRAWASARTSTTPCARFPGTPHRLRTDVSATLFLNAPEDYDGGELVIEDTLRHPFGQARRRRHGGLSGQQPASRAAGDPRGARWPRSSGSRAWCATTARARCCTRWMRRHPGAHRAGRRCRAVCCGSRAAITTCCGAGRSCSGMGLTRVANGAGLGAGGESARDWRTCGA